MRLRYRASRRRGLDDGTVPLVNVGFLLLLHLLVAGEIGGIEGLPLAPPDIDHAQRLNERPSVQIDVAPGEPLVVRINQQRVPLRELHAHLPEPDEEHPPILRADANLTTAQLSSLLATLRQAGFAKLRLATQRNE